MPLIAVTLKRTVVETRTIKVYALSHLSARRKALAVADGREFTEEYGQESSGNWKAHKPGKAQVMHSKPK